MVALIVGWIVALVMAMVAVMVLPLSIKQAVRVGMVVMWGGALAMLGTALVAPATLDSGIMLPWSYLFGVALEFKVTGLSWVLSLATLIAGGILVGGVTLPSRWAVALLIWIQLALLLVLNAGDLLTLFIGWEWAMLPVYIGLVTHGTDKAKAMALRMLMMMVTGGVLFLMALVMVWVVSPSMTPLSLSNGAVLPPVMAWIVGGLFLVSFAIKTPLFPFHTWQAALYEHCPSYCRPLVMAVVSKLGVWGVLQVLPVVTPGLGLANAGGPVSLLVWGLALWVSLSALYASVVAWGQSTPIRALAYMSMSHMAVAFLGALLGPSHGVMVGLYLVAHTVLVLGLSMVIQSQPNWNVTGGLGGMMGRSPWQAWVLLVLMLGFIGLPGTVGFAAELSVIVAIFSSYPLIIGGVILFPVVMNAWVGLRWLTEMVWGQPLIPVLKDDVPSWWRVALGALVVVTLVGGLFPWCLQRVISVGLPLW